jgi:hypothetical protein
MTSCNSKISVKISPDIDEIYIDETYISTLSPSDSSKLSPMQISAKTARKIAQEDEQFDLFNASSKPRLKSQSTMNLLEIQKKQDKERSVANLAAILNLLDVQICLEKDPEILAILTSQKTTMNEILIQKQSGKKGSFKTAEKEAISQLQNQVSCLEKSVDKKFETILEFIKNSQLTINSWAQIAAQSIQKEQEQQQKLTITKEQKQASKQQSKTQAKREATA